jgi:hypothetical protein
MMVSNAVLPSQCMAKFKPFKGKPKGRTAPQGGISCLILVISAIFLVMFLFYYVMKNANG